MGDAAHRLAGTTEKVPSFWMFAWTRSLTKAAVAFVDVLAAPDAFEHRR